MISSIPAAELITFLVTASGVTFFGVDSAFWGLVAGLVLFGAWHLGQSSRHS